MNFFVNKCILLFFHRSQQVKRKRKVSIVPVVEEKIERGPARAQLIDFRPKDEDDIEEEERQKKQNETALAKLRAAEAEAKRREEEEEQVRLKEKESVEALLKATEETSALETAKTEMRLNVNSFRSLWTVLETAGSFQCKLKAAPNIGSFTDHMKRQVVLFSANYLLIYSFPFYLNSLLIIQGFHVIFATAPPTGGIEVGICNIRTTGDEAWFMARFIASTSTFSAVMKAQDPSIVEKYVKKFSLAKILKIDA
jgi:hypothetical protein